MRFAKIILLAALTLILSLVALSSGQAYPYYYYNSPSYYNSNSWIYRPYTYTSYYSGLASPLYYRPYYYLGPVYYYGPQYYSRFYTNYYNTWHRPSYYYYRYVPVNYYYGPRYYYTPSHYRWW